MPAQLTETRRTADNLSHKIAGGLDVVYLTVSQVARQFPPSRNGKPVHVATVTRWIVDGSRLRNGSVVRLRAVRLPGRWVVEPEAVEEFLAALTADRAGAPESPAPTSAPATPTTTARRRKDDELSRRRLDEIGIGKG